MYLTPFSQAGAITPSDTDDFATNGRLSDAIYVGGAGTVAVVFEDGSTATFTSVAGGYLWVKAKRINSTGTSATLLVALYRV